MTSEGIAPPTLSFRESGTGPDLLLLHGLGGDRLVWDPLLPDLAKDFRVWAPDLRGHGETPLPAESTLSFEELERDLLDFLGHHGLTAVHLVGFSAGAFLALRFALDHPERVRTLTLVSGAAYCDAHQKAVMERWWSTYDKEGADAFALRWLKDLFYPDWIEAHLDVADLIRDQAPTRDFTAARAWAKSLEQFDEKNRIALLRIPTLMVQAMDDAVVDASHGRILRQSITGAQIRILVQTGHMIPIERPSELADSIRTLAAGGENPAVQPTN
jgi:pimeloyl-ACP methyl ester carboxylesterase